MYVTLTIPVVARFLDNCSMRMGAVVRCQQVSGWRTFFVKIGSDFLLNILLLMKLISTGLKPNEMTFEQPD